MPKKIVMVKDDGITKAYDIDVDETTNEAVILNPDGTVRVNLEKHASRHSYGGADAIPDNALRFSQLDKVFGTESATSIGAGATYTIPKGIYYVRCDADVRVEYSPDGGTTWITVISAGGAGLIISDGSNVRAVNAGTASENVYLLPIL